MHTKTSEPLRQYYTNTMHATNVELPSPEGDLTPMLLYVDSGHWIDISYGQP